MLKARVCLSLSSKFLWLESWKQSTTQEVWSRRAPAWNLWRYENFNEKSPGAFMMRSIMLNYTLSAWHAMSSLHLWKYTWLYGLMLCFIPSHCIATSILCKQTFTECIFCSGWRNEMNRIATVENVTDFISLPAHGMKLSKGQRDFFPCCGCSTWICGIWLLADSNLSTGICPSEIVLSVCVNQSSIRTWIWIERIPYIIPQPMFHNRVGCSTDMD